MKGLPSPALSEGAELSDPQRALPVPAFMLGFCWSSSGGSLPVAGWTHTMIFIIADIHSARGG